MGRNGPLKSSNRDIKNIDTETHLTLRELNPVSVSFNSNDSLELSASDLLKISSPSANKPGSPKKTNLKKQSQRVVPPLELPSRAYEDRPMIESFGMVHNRREDDPTIFNMDQLSKSSKDEISDDEVENPLDPEMRACLIKSMRLYIPKDHFNEFIDLESAFKDLHLGQSYHKVNSVDYIPLNDDDFQTKINDTVGMNFIHVNVTEEPKSIVGPGEIIPIKCQLVNLENQSPVTIYSACYDRMLSSNGIVYRVNLSSHSIFVVLRLVINETPLQLAELYHGGLCRGNVIETSEFIHHNHQCGYYIPRPRTIVNTPLGVTLDNQQLIFFVRIMLPSVNLQRRQDHSFKFIFNVVNNLANEFTSTNKIYSSEIAKKPVVSYLREMIHFIDKMQLLNHNIKIWILQIEKYISEGFLSGEKTKKIISEGESKPMEIIKKIVKYMIKYCPENLAKQNYNGLTMLHYLCTFGDTEIVVMVLDSMNRSHINTLDANGRTALCNAIEMEHGEIVKLLLDKGKILTNKDIRGETECDYAFRLGKIKMVHLINEVRNLQSSNDDPGTDRMMAMKPLRDSILYGHFNATEFKQLISRILSYHSSPSSSSMNINNFHSEGTKIGSNDQLLNNTELAHLVKDEMDVLGFNKKFDLSLEKLTSGLDHLDQVIDQDDPIHASDMTTKLDNDPLKNMSVDDSCMVSQNSGNECVINLPYEKGITICHLAAVYGCSEALHILIQSGANINAKDFNHTTPLHQAISNFNLPNVKVLLEREDIDLDAKDSTGITPLNLAVMLDFLPAVTMLVERGADLSNQVDHNLTPLHYACIYGYFDMVSYLLDKGADPNAMSNELGGLTPLHESIRNGHNHIARLLLDFNADIKLSNYLSLSLAAINSNIETLEFILHDYQIHFLKKSTGQNEQDEDVDSDHSLIETKILKINNFSIIHAIASAGYLNNLILLANAGANLAVVDDNGATALHMSALSGTLDCAEFLIRSGAIDVNATDYSKSTPLHRASAYGHDSIVRLLIQSGGSLNCANADGMFPLHFASLYGHINCVQTILDYADHMKVELVEKRDNMSMTPLMYAVPYPDLVRLISNNQELGLNQQDSEGKTALYHSAMNHYESSTKIMIEFGADPFISDYAGNAPLDLIADEFKNIINDAIKLHHEKGDIDAEKKWEDAVRLFNANEQGSVDHLISNRLIENSPDAIARFLLKENQLLNPKLVGLLLCKKEEHNLRMAFVNRLNFEGISLDKALRQYLQLFLLPGEAQQIDRVIECLAHRYVENNTTTFPDKDTAFILSFALIMLNTDAHNPNIPPDRRMTKAQFIQNQRSLWGPEHQDPPEDLLSTLYDNILSNEIKFRTQDSMEKQGFLKRYRASGFSTFSRVYWFILHNQCLFFFSSQSDCDPVGLIPLENAQIRKKDSVKKTKKFSLVSAQENGLLKYCKMNKGNIVQCVVHEVILGVDKYSDAEAWIRAISLQIASKPFQLCITERSEELTAQFRSREAMFGISAIVDFSNFYNLALLCESGYLSESEIKKRYSKATVSCVIERDDIHLVIINNAIAQKQNLIIVGNLFVEPNLSEMVNEDFDYKVFFKIHLIVEELLDDIRKYLEPEWTLQITGHSLGAVVCVFVASELLRENLKCIKLTTFGQPKCMDESMINILKPIVPIRVINVNDPVDELFQGYFHSGHYVILLKNNWFCYQNSIPQLMSELGSSNTPQTNSLINSSTSMSETYNLTSSNKRLSSATPSGGNMSLDLVCDESSREQFTPVNLVNTLTPRWSARKKIREKDSPSSMASVVSRDKKYSIKASMSRSVYHQIDYYLKRIKEKLRTETKHVSPDEIHLYR